MSRCHRCFLVDSAEDPVLLGIGILEFINHRHRKTSAQCLRQQSAVFLMQRVIQPGQQIIKSHFAPVLFFLRDGPADLIHRAGKQDILQRQCLCCQFLNRREHRM